MLLKWETNFFTFENTQKQKQNFKFVSAISENNVPTWIIKKFNVLCSEFAKKNFEMDILEKIEKSNFWIFFIFENFFSRFYFASACKNFLLFQFFKAAISRLSDALSSGKKYWKLILQNSFQICSSSSFFVILRVKKWKFAKNANFQALLQQKLKVVWKKYPGPKSCKIAQTFEWNQFYAKKIIFGHFRAKNVFWKKSIFSDFFCIFWKFAKNANFQALLQQKLKVVWKK